MAQLWVRYEVDPAGVLTVVTQLVHPEAGRASLVELLACSHYANVDYPAASGQIECGTIDVQPRRHG